MTKTVIEMARGAGFWSLVGDGKEPFVGKTEAFERFAALVAEAISDIKYEKGYEDGYAAALRIMK